MAERIELIREDFSFLDNWEDRYQYLIDLGDELQPLAAGEKCDASFVSGCMSNVWVVAEPGADGRMRVRGESDSSIVRGLAALLAFFYSSFPATEIASHDALDLFREFNLENHLSPNRRNGLSALNRRIRAAAS